VKKLRVNLGGTEDDFWIRGGIKVKLNDIDTSTKEGKLLIAILSDVTSRPYLGNAVFEKPSSTWHPDDALNYYAQQAEKIFAE
jgi:hypothetical protein